MYYYLARDSDPSGRKSRGFICFLTIEECPRDACGFIGHRAEALKMAMHGNSGRRERESVVTERWNCADLSVIAPPLRRRQKLRWFKPPAEIVQNPTKPELRRIV